MNRNEAIRSILTDDVLNKFRFIHISVDYNLVRLDGDYEDGDDLNGYDPEVQEDGDTWWEKEEEVNGITVRYLLIERDSHPKDKPASLFEAMNDIFEKGSD